MNTRRGMAAVGVFMVALMLMAGAVAQVDWSAVTEQKLLASDAQAGDELGVSVSIDGDTMVVGALSEDAGGSNAGAAYVFTRSGSTWTEQQKLVASDAQAGDWFGSAVGVSGDTAVVTAILEDTGNTDAGAAYVFVRSGSTWTQQAKLVPPVPEVQGLFGVAASINENTIIIGADQEDPAGLESGAAYVFTRSGTTWSLQQKILSSDLQAGDNFGHSVAINGESLVVGARREDAAASNAGAAYVFTRSGSTWTEQQKLVASDAEANDQFGRGVSISGDSVIVGAWFEDAGGSDAGAAYVFTRSGSTWTEQQKLVASDAQAGDWFGASVSLNGESIVVGAPLEDQGGADAGAAYVFTRSGSTWTEQQKLVASDAQAGDQSGVSVSLDGDATIVGAEFSDAGGLDAGAVYVYTGIEDETPPDTTPTIDGGNLFGDDGIFYGGNKTNIAVAMQVPEAGLDAMMGSLWVLVLAGIGWGAIGGSASGAAVGGATGFVVSFAFGLFPLWVLWLAIMLAAAFLFVRRGGD